MRFLVISALLMPVCGGVLAQYKCTGAGGSISFQQTPCQGGARQQSLELRSLPPTSAGNPAAPSLKEQNAELDKRLAIRIAIESHTPLVGMTESELFQAVGRPTEANKAQYGQTAQDQNIYRLNGRTLYVYTKNGVVTAIQNIENVKSPQDREGMCLSQSQLRELEIDASRTAVQSNPEVLRKIRAAIIRGQTC